MYRFYFDRDVLPVTPSAITTTFKNQNKTITLINEGEVNLLKEAGLTEFTFKFMLPWCNYPFVNINYPSALTDAIPTLDSVLSGKWKLSSAVSSLKSVTLKNVLHGSDEQLNIFPSQKEWIEKLSKYKTEKKVFQFKVQRIDSGFSLNNILDRGTNVFGDALSTAPITQNINLRGWTMRTGHVQFAGWTTDIYVSLEDIKIVEDAKEYKDVWVEVKLKEWKPYGTKVFEEKDGQLVEKGDKTEDVKKEVDKEKQEEECLPKTEEKKEGTEPISGEKQETAQNTIASEKETSQSNSDQSEPKWKKPWKITDPQERKEAYEELDRQRDMAKKRARAARKAGKV